MEGLTVPYIDQQTYTIIPRMTEVISVLDCEMKGYLHPVNQNKKEWKEMSTYVALKGTLLHHRIENFCRQKIGLPPVDLELSSGDQKMYNEVMKLPHVLNWMNAENEKGWKNFIKFWEDFQPEVISPEETLVYFHIENGELVPKKSLKGTVDLLAVLDPDKMSDKAKKILPLVRKSTILIDWKSGSTAMELHKVQLTGYHWMMKNTGRWDELIDLNMIKHEYAHIRLNGKENPVAICLLLGGKEYKAKVYNLNNDMFDEARKIFFQPRPLVLSRLRFYNEFNRESYGCVFCTYRDNGCAAFKIEEVNIDENKK